ncbi:MAG: thiolase family protein [Thermoplasmatota archaeon]
MADALIIDAVRTPFGKRGGAFKDMHPQELAAIPLAALVRRNGLAPNDVEDVIYGNVTPVGEQGMNIGRIASLAAGLGDQIPGVQINRMCGSGQQALNFAAGQIRGGFANILVAGGVEHMTRVEIGSDMGPMSDALTERFEIVHQGESAERIADKWGFSREDLDRFAFDSQQKMKRAVEEGRYKSQILPVTVKVDGVERVVEADEHPRPGTTLEKLLSLKPVFRENGKITAGNSSGIVDGSAALLVSNEKTAKARGWKPLARVVAQHVAGVDPTIMLTGPIPATQGVLAKAGLTVDDIDLFECNEAFASVPLAWMHDTGVPAAKSNVNGGAIAHGHPLGATGAALITKLVYELERTGGRYGLSTMCIGFGQGIATVIERM